MVYGLLQGNPFKVGRGKDCVKGILLGFANENVCNYVNM